MSLRYSPHSPSVLQRGFFAAVFQPLPPACRANLRTCPRPTASSTGIHEVFAADGNQTGEPSPSTIHGAPQTARAVIDGLIDVVTLALAGTFMHRQESKKLRRLGQAPAPQQRALHLNDSVLVRKGIQAIRRGDW